MIDMNKIDEKRIKININLLKLSIIIIRIIVIKKHSSKFTSFFSFASFESLLNLFIVAFTFCYQTIFLLKL